MIVMGLLGKVLDSPQKAILLELVLGRRGEFSISGLSRLSGISKASVSRIISDWENAGLVECMAEGRNKMVSVNRRFYLLPELKRMLGKLKDFQRPLIEALRRSPSTKSPKVRAVVVFGSRARGDFTSKSDLDVLFVVSDKETMEGRIMEELAGLSGSLGVQLSPVVMSEKDFSGRLKAKDKFVSNILSEGKVIRGGAFIGKLQRASESRR